MLQGDISFTVSLFLCVSAKNCNGISGVGSANFMRFPTVKKSRLRFDKVTESLKVGTFLRHSVVLKVLNFFNNVSDCIRAKSESVLQTVHSVELIVCI